MQQKAFTLHNRGMNRDLSISKAGESAAYENHNIRIEARDGDTALSVTNERGNKEIVLSEVGILGELIGWNVLDNHIILFTHEETPVATNKPDHIYRIDYEPNTEHEFIGLHLFSGRLNFDLDSPIESVVYHETDEIQKIYWVDGRNVLRFMNFMAGDAERARWNTDPTLFDSNKGTEFNISVFIDKDYAGNTRPNGVVQYILTYYNEHGQESGPVWVSDVVYLSPSGTGGSADGTNTCRVTITIKGADTKFSNYRVYSLFRSTENGTPVSYIVSDGNTSSNIVAIDDYANQTAEDSSKLLYLGSQPVIAGTLTHKDQTLFLGDIAGAGRGDLYDALDAATAAMHSTDGYVLNDAIVFDWEEGPDSPDSDEIYPYVNQLQSTSSKILSFKGGEKYRFALVFKFADGTTTDAFWIGDAINQFYPRANAVSHKIERIIARCTLPQSVYEVIDAYNSDPKTTTPIKAVQLMIAEATYADRSIKAQGILCPTVFNVWERYNNRLYAQASWIMRPRNSDFACRHFEPVHISSSSTGEIDCSYWEATSPTPYYTLTSYNSDGIGYGEEFDGTADYDYVMVIYHIIPGWVGSKVYKPQVFVVKAKLLQNTEAAKTAVETLQFAQTQAFLTQYQYMLLMSLGAALSQTAEVEDEENGYYRLTLYLSPTYNYKVTFNSETSSHFAWTNINNYLTNEVDLRAEDIVGPETFDAWCEAAWDDRSAQNPKQYFNYTKSTHYNAYITALDDDGTHGSDRWIDVGASLPDTWDYTPSYYKKHLMFVDENTVTLNSPELDYNAVSFDKASGYKLRIVGVAKITSSQSDYYVLSSPGKYPGENLVNDSFNSVGSSGNHDGLTSWPLWLEYGLRQKTEDPDDPNYSFPDDPKDRDSNDFEWGGSRNTYWLHMWNHAGKINGYTDKYNSDYSNLSYKIFANLRVSNLTVYNNLNSASSYPPIEIPQSSLRVFNFVSGQYLGLNVADDTMYYDANIKTSLMPPGNHKYPVYFSSGRSDTAKKLDASNYDLMLNSPVSIDYRSTAHAVIALPSRYDNGYYYQRTLPTFTGKDNAMPYILPTRNTTTYKTGALLPWINNNPGGTGYPYVDYLPDPDNPGFSLGENNSLIANGDRYLYIGEIYRDYTGNEYGGTSTAAIQNNKFVVAGPQVAINALRAGNTALKADRGDTYFQRWDCLKTKPYSGTTNEVIDITSVMLETHINIDGRTDLQRGISQLASLDYENFNSLNWVYSQKDTYQTRRDLDDDFNLDSYRSTLTWTLQKNDLADVDEWTHITLASTLKLDGDRGILRALRRMQNSIIAFQDKGISEILFNSRTQLSTTDGVPVELANSGKVDGKRYITNKYGCLNKWSIVEGKAGLYFVDNINKAFCLFSGNAVDSLSDKLGFGVWFKDSNKTKPWSPEDIANPEKESNLISFYDREHSDIYLVKDSTDDMACLVYNENLQSFTSFFDYSSVPMITNVRDRLVSFKDANLWLQNEGLYCNFFNHQYDFWVQYRVTPEPFSDKLWTNFDYRADFYHLLDENAMPQLPEEYLINGDFYGDTADIYKESETFTTYKVWNEYQTTGDVALSLNTAMLDPVRKKFRIWRIAIARAIKEGTNKHGLDRIRNPWTNLLLRKVMTEDNNQFVAQLHDIVVRYFE